MSDESCGVRVVVRLRPVNEREQRELGVFDPSQFAYMIDDSRSIHITGKLLGGTEFRGTFDRVFDCPTQQQDVFEEIAIPAIQDAFKGYNGTILAYGQTGSGKSFSMFGAGDLINGDLRGLIPRTVGTLFVLLRQASDVEEVSIKLSFLEIYNEVVRDLLNPHNMKLRIRERPDDSIFVEGLVESFVTSEREIFSLIARGEANRSVGATDMNKSSSRSHSLLTLTIEQKGKDGSTRVGKLNFGDLAGSEKIKKTGATGKTLDEAKKINQSLSSLGNCIFALTEEKRGHVPFRDSKLTYILKNSLGGNSKTTLLVTCSPHPFNAEETVSTLRFAQRAKLIKNKVVVNRQRSAAELLAALEDSQEKLRISKVHISNLNKIILASRSANFQGAMSSNMESLIKQANDFVASLLSGDSPSTEMTYSSSASTVVSNDSFESSSLMVASTPASTAVDLQSEESKSEETLVSQSHRVEELESKLRSLQEILQEQAQEHEENVHTLQTEMKGVQSQLMIKIAELETNENSMNELRGHWTSERMEFQHKLLQAQQENQMNVERVSLAYRELEAAHKKASSLQNLLQINEAQSRDLQLAIHQNRSVYDLELANQKTLLQSAHTENLNLKKQLDNIQVDRQQSQSKLESLQQELLNVQELHTLQRANLLDDLENERDRVSSLTAQIAQLELQISNISSQSEEDHIAIAQRNSEMQFKLEAMLAKERDVSRRHFEQLRQEMVISHQKSESVLKAEVLQEQMSKKELQAKLLAAENELESIRIESMLLHQNLDHQSREVKVEISRMQQKLEQVQQQSLLSEQESQEKITVLCARLEVAERDRIRLEATLNETRAQLEQVDSDRSELRASQHSWNQEKLAFQEKVSDLNERWEKHIQLILETEEQRQEELRQLEAGGPRIAKPMRVASGPAEAVSRASSSAAKTSSSIESISASAASSQPMHRRRGTISGFFSSLFGSVDQQDMKESDWTDQNIIFSGFMFKVSDWKRDLNKRYFELRAKNLVFWTDDDSQRTASNVRGVIPLAGAEIVTSDDRSITIQYPTGSFKTVKLQAVSDSDAALWLKALKDCVSSLSSK